MRAGTCLVFLGAVASAVLSVACSLDFGVFKEAQGDASVDVAQVSDAATSGEDGASATGDGQMMEDTGATMDAGGTMDTGATTDALDAAPDTCPQTTNCIAEAGACGTTCGQVSQQCQNNCNSVPCKHGCQNTEKTCRTTCANDCTTCTQSVGCPEQAACMDAAGAM